MRANYRAQKSGYAREIQKKLIEKFDKTEAAKVLRWIRCLSPSSSVPDTIKAAFEKIPDDIQEVDMDNFHCYLMDGLVLGHLIACLKFPPPNITAEIWTISDKPIFEISRQRERISLFISFCSELGLDSSTLFQTNDLYERTNLTQVIICIAQVGVEVQTKPGYTGPGGYWTLKQSGNKMEFTDEHKRYSERIDRLQIGTSKIGNSSGVCFAAQ